MGPIAHHCAVKQMVRFAQALGTPLVAGGLLDSIQPDLTKNHEDWRGQLNAYFPVVCQKLRDKKDISVEMRNVCHFLVDYHSVTQIMSGSSYLKDFVVDTWAETVIQKDEYSVTIPSYTSFTKWDSSLEASLRDTIVCYADKAHKWNFIFTSAPVDMIRRAVKLSTEFSVSYMALASKA